MSEVVKVLTVLADRVGSDGRAIIRHLIWVVVGKEHTTYCGPEVKLALAMDSGRCKPPRKIRRMTG